MFAMLILLIMLMLLSVAVRPLSGSIAEPSYVFLNSKMRLKSASVILSRSSEVESS